jgi:glycosyltransferase involved in cell wall biosynthesis
MKICFGFSNRSWIKQEVEILKSIGFNVIELPLYDLPSPQCLIFLIKNLRSLISCDVIYKWFAFPAVVFIGKALGKPTVLNAVGVEVALYPEFDYGWPSWWYAKAITSIGLRNADYVLAISEESKRWAERWGARNVTVIYEGIDTDKFKYKAKGKDNSRNKIVTVAYLSLANIKRKDFFTLLKALKLVVNVLPDVKLIIVGEKMDGYPFLVKTAKEVGVADAVIFKGFVSFEELLNIIYDASVFVMPSLQEGFPTALCEALSCGVPIVTTNRPAMNEVFENNIHGLLVEAKNPQKLAEAIITILTNRDLSEVIAYNGRKLIEEKYSKKVRAKKLKNFFLTVLNNVRKYNKYQSVDIMWLIIFITLCFISPIIIILHDLLNKLFKQ